MQIFHQWPEASAKQHHPVRTQLNTLERFSLIGLAPEKGSLRKIIRSRFVPPGWHHDEPRESTYPTCEVYEVDTLMMLHGCRRRSLH